MSIQVCMFLINIVHSFDLFIEIEIEIVFVFTSHSKHLGKSVRRSNTSWQRILQSKKGLIVSASCVLLFTAVNILEWDSWPIVYNKV